ncbi:ZinT family metal-binding protein [Paracoccus aestuariivivens]|nr:ZinT/AdcA family metal-binding protein [Paracoccus aestuariivivens]
MLLISGAALAGGEAAGQHDHKHAHSHEHAHDHDHGNDAAAAIRKGHFDDSEIQDRTLSDWEGDWQSVYPYLVDGTLDPVMAHKAEHGDKTAAEYRDYYEAGYRTDVDRIVIKGDRIEFYRSGASVSARYVSDGRETLTYKAGNRGVRYAFRKADGDTAAPAFIQFSDHAIAPEKAGHYHLYWGDDRKALLAEVTHWPTYYPTAMSGQQIQSEMMAH